MAGNILSIYFFLILSGFLPGLVFIYILKKLSLRHNLLMPQGMPLVGGIGMGLSFIFVALSVFLVNKGLSKEIVGIIASSSVMLAFGVFDDWRELANHLGAGIAAFAVLVSLIIGIKMSKTDDCHN